MQTLHIRTSERTTAKRCPQRWFWSYVEELQSLRKRNPLWFGGAIHEGLASYYIPGKKRGPHPLERTLAVLDENREMIVTNEDQEREWVEASELATDMLNGYVEFWKGDPNFDVIAPELPFKAKIPSHRKNVRIQYNGTFDLVFRDLDTGEIFILESKTAAQISTDHLALDEQNGSYATFADIVLHKKGLIKDREHVAGVRYNFLRKAMADTRPVNPEGLFCNKPQKQHYIDALYNHFGEDEPLDVMEQWEHDLPKMTLAKLEELASIQGITVFGDPSKNQGSPRFVRKNEYRSLAQRRRMVKRIKDEAVYLQAWRDRDPAYPIYKTPTRDCSWQCEFYNLCHLDEQGDDVEVAAYKETMFKHWDPYEDHRSDASRYEEK